MVRKVGFGGGRRRRKKSAEHTRGGEAQKEFGLIIVERRVLESSEKRNMKNHKTSIR
jgi:hypothetical protein